MSTGFTMRTTKPEAGNKYYIRRASGGYSGAIKGSPADPECDVLANCVGYAVGRFNEIGGWGSCKYLSPVNAENFIQYKGGLEVSQTPQLGACMVWQKGATLTEADGAGHVAIVEKVVSGTEVVTSESAYGGAAFRTQTRKKGADGKWGMGNGYTFLGFILNPAPCCRTGATESTAGAETTSADAAVTERRAADAAMSFDKELAGTYTVDTAAGLHIRNGAGTGKASMAVLPGGTKVRNYGYYTLSGGVKWLYIQVTYNGVKYTGFSSGEYLRKQ